MRKKLQTEILALVENREQESYGFSLKRSMEEETGRKVSLSRIHKTLAEMENSGLLKSIISGTSPNRHGNRRRVFEITAYGRKMMRQQSAQTNTGSSNSLSITL